MELTVLPRAAAGFHVATRSVGSTISGRRINRQELRMRLPRQGHTSKRASLNASGNRNTHIATTKQPSVTPDHCDTEVRLPPKGIAAASLKEKSNVSRIPTSPVDEKIPIAVPKSPSSNGAADGIFPKNMPSPSPNRGDRPALLSRRAQPAAKLSDTSGRSAILHALRNGRTIPGSPTTAVHLYRLRPRAITRRYQETQRVQLLLVKNSGKSQAVRRPRARSDSLERV